MVYRIYIDIRLLHPVKHGIPMLFEMNGTIAIFLKPGMSAVFQASGNHRKPVPCFQGILPYTVGSLVIYTRERYDLPELSPVYARERQLNWKIFSLAGIIMKSISGCWKQRLDR